MVRRSVRRSAALVITLSLLAPAHALAVTWGPAIPITDSGQAAAWAGGLSVTGTNGAQVAYRELVDGSPQVFIRRSTDGGDSWEPPIALTGAGGTAPSLASNGSNVDLVWRQHASDGTVKIKYRRSPDSGVNWTSPMTLASLPGDGFPIPRVARDGAGRVAVAWTNATSGKVFVKVSTDGGVSFAPGVSVGVTTNTPWEEAPAAREAFPALAIAAGRIHVTYYTSAARLDLRRSSNNGGSWSTAQVIATNGSGWVPSVAAAGRAVVVGYAIYTGDDIWSVVRVSGDGGVTWGSPKALASRTSNPSFQPVITVRGGVWRALFERCTAADCSGSAVLMRQSFNSGLSWGTAFRASPSAVQYASPIGAQTSGARALAAYQSFDPVTEDTNIAIRPQTGS